jgi:peptidoglycan/LPS O-acetylase OafA/YrhL
MAGIHKLYREKRVFGGFDGLRFLSITAVVWHHSVKTPTIFPITKYGFLGVDLFFVISGFLIVTLLLRERDRTGEISLKAFYIRRSLRIFPLYYLFILGLALIYFLFNQDSESGRKFLSELPIYLLYLGNFFPVTLDIVWSLAAEQQFYLVWPVVEKYLKKYIFPILVGTLAINQIINFQREAIANWLGIPEVKDLFMMQITFTPILLGIVLAHLLHYSSSFKYCQKLLLPKYSALLWLITLIASSFFFPEDISGFPRLWVQILMVLLVGSIAINEQNQIMPFLMFPPIVRIGVISYGIYLFHIHAIAVAQKILSKIALEQELAVFVLGYAISIIAAELSYRFYEMPFLRLKGKFSIIHQNHS